MISKQEAVLRIALGSDSLRNYVSNKEKTLAEDYIIIEKMALLGKVGLGSIAKL